MNTHITAHKAKIRHICFFLILCFHLVSAGVPGPCKHSITQDHLLNLRRLIKNQLQNGCSITYTFIEQQNLSIVCYVKAALPQILDLLNSNFQYAKDSDNYRYTNSLKNLIYNIYSQRCVPPINEEIEDSPAKFVRIHVSLPRKALEKAEEVISMFMGLMTKNNKPVDWNCEEEYTEDYPESSTEQLGQIETSDGPECTCSCPVVTSTFTEAPDSTSKWNNYLKSTSPSRLASSSLVPRQEWNARTNQVKSKSEESNPVSGTLRFIYASWTSATKTLKRGDLPLGRSGLINEETTTSSSSEIIPSFAKFGSSSRTDSTLKSSISGPYQHGIQDNIERSTTLLLAKRSLESKNQEGTSSSYPSMPHAWATATPVPKVHEKTTEITSTPFQTSLMSHNIPINTSVEKTPLSSSKSTVHSSQNLTSLIEQQDSRFQEGRQDGLDQIFKDHPDQESQWTASKEETSTSVLWFGYVVIIVIGCSGLSIIILLVYTNKQVSVGRCLPALLNRPA